MLSIALHTNQAAMHKIDAFLGNVTTGMHQRAVKSALKSCGYKYQQELKAYGRRASQSIWPRPSPWTSSLKKRREGAHSPSRLEYWKRGPYKGKIKPAWKSKGFSRRKYDNFGSMSRLVNTVAYEVVADFDEQGSLDEGFVEISFADTSQKKTFARKGRFEHSTPRKLVALNAKRQSQPITPKMRRYLFAMGIPVPANQSTITAPARPWTGPVYESIKDDIPVHFEKKFVNALIRYSKKYGMENVWT